MAKYKKLSDKYLKMVDRFHSYLLQNQDKILIGLPWDIEVIKRLKIGYDQVRQCLVFPVYNKESELLNLYRHKAEKYPPKMVKGAPSKMLYPLPLIAEYPKDEPLVYCEGPKDVITLRSNGFNAVSHIGGATSIPDDLSPLSDFSHIITAFDKDDPGRKATQKLTKKLTQGVQ